MKLRLWMLVALVAIMFLDGCAGMVKNAPGSPRTNATVENASEQVGVANVATGAVTGLSYQSVLPMGMVILLTIIVLSQTGANMWNDWLSHRQQMIRLKQNGNP